MSELQSSQSESSNAQTAATSAVPEPVKSSGSKPANGRPLVYFLMLALAAGVGGSWWYSHTELTAMRAEVAKRLQSADKLNSEMKGVVGLVQDNSKAMQAQLSVLENKQAEAQSQQVALEQMYQELSKNNDERALTEIENLLTMASRQLELAGNVKAALLALQTADKSLASFDKQQFTSVRRALANDIERVKAVPDVDVTGMALRLDSIVSQIDKMPLLSDERPPEALVMEKTTASHAAAQPAPVADGAGTVEADGMHVDWWTNVQLKWQSLSSELWTQLQQMVSIRRVDKPDVILMSPSQAFFVRENLKLRVLGARFALLSRNELAFRNDLNAAQSLVAQYFDTRAGQVQSAQALLKQVQESDVTIDMPTLSESINAVQQYQVRR